jgi:hypothetical protein
MRKIKKILVWAAALVGAIGLVSYKYSNFEFAVTINNNSFVTQVITPNSKADLSIN